MKIAKLLKQPVKVVYPDPSKMPPLVRYAKIANAFKELREAGVMIHSIDLHEEAAAVMDLTVTFSSYPAFPHNIIYSASGGMATPPSKGKYFTPLTPIPPGFSFK